ncbi:hypothetical protein IV84_GL001970 [Pediococcus damnosus]|nr:hypothetical protein IV84_GL001970 [Pediococcus damnosus]
MIDTLFKTAKISLGNCLTIAINKINTHRCLSNGVHKRRRIIFTNRNRLIRINRVFANRNGLSCNTFISSGQVITANSLRSNHYNITIIGINRHSAICISCRNWCSTINRVCESSISWYTRFRNLNLLSIHSINSINCTICGSWNRRRVICFVFIRIIVCWFTISSNISQLSRINCCSRYP